MDVEDGSLGLLLCCFHLLAVALVPMAPSQQRS